MPTTKMRGEEDHPASAEITTGPFLEEMAPHETTLMGGGEEDDPITVGQAGEEDYDPGQTTFAATNPFGTF